MRGWRLIASGVIIKGKIYIRIDIGRICSLLFLHETWRISYWKIYDMIPFEVLVPVDHSMCSDSFISVETRDNQNSSITMTRSLLTRPMFKVIKLTLFIITSLVSSCQITNIMDPLFVPDHRFPTLYVLFIRFI